MNNSLIYGKAGINNIVSLEDKGDGFVELFIQDANGKITTKDIRHDYWLLTSEPADDMSIELEGNGYFKYKNTFNLAEDFEYTKKRMWKYKNKAYWCNDYKEAFMLDTGHGYYQGLKHSEVSVLSFDIETVGLKLDENSKVLLISNTFRDSKGNIERKLFAYDDYSTNKEFLEAWCDWVREKDPSIVMGFNCYSFDFLYLDFIANRCGIELMLGRKNKALKFNHWTSKFRKDQSQFVEYKKCYIYGREIVDCFHLAIRHDIVEKKYENYKLKNIIKQEGIEKKDRTFYDASLIRKNYKIPSEWPKIKDYCKDDSDDVLALWDIMGAAAFYWTQKVPKSFGEVTSGATGSQLNSILIRSYLQDDYSLPKASETKQFKGAISIGVAGIYKNCLRFDIKSMYPSIILEYKLFNKEKDPKSHFLKITEQLTEQRFEHKKLANETKNKYYKDLEQSEKIGINSLYGLTNTKGLLFNSPEIGEFITKKGREVLTIAIKWATNKNINEFNYEE